MIISWPRCSECVNTEYVGIVAAYYGSARGIFVGNYFRHTRDVELSLIYFLRTQFDADWTGVTVVKSFKQAYSKDVNVPIVCVRVTSSPREMLELGSTLLRRRFNILIDIFARSGGQRLDLSDYIIDTIKNGWIYYDHYQSTANRKVLVRVPNGRVTPPIFNDNSQVEFSDTVEKRDRFRHLINITTEKFI